LNASGAVIDSSKAFVCGHSLGGWTSLAAAFGEQDVFKATLSFDPRYYCDLDELAGN
jgi:predicted alpha/beta superfamily hydrolase